MNTNTQTPSTWFHRIKFVFFMVGTASTNCNWINNWFFALNATEEWGPYIKCAQNDLAKIYLNSNFESCVPFEIIDVLISPKKSPYCFSFSCMCQRKLNCVDDARPMTPVHNELESSTEEDDKMMFKWFIVVFRCRYNFHCYSTVHTDHFEMKSLRQFINLLDRSRKWLCTTSK